MRLRAFDSAIRLHGGCQLSCVRPLLVARDFSSISLGGRPAKLVQAGPFF